MESIKKESVNTQSTSTALDAVQSIPRDGDGPIFNAPWEAEAFAMTLTLHEKGVFTWQEWADTLSLEIKTAQNLGDPDLGDTYYSHWLSALERIVVEKGVTSRSTLGELYTAWDEAARATPHGEPITLPGSTHKCDT